MKTVSETNYEMANADINCFTRLEKYAQAHENLVNATAACEVAEKDYMEALKRQKKAKRKHLIAKVLSKFMGVKNHESTI